MNDALIADICTVASTMKSDQKWTAAHDEAFLVGLEDLPDEAGVILRREILRQFDWRPSVKEIRDLWQKLSTCAPVIAEEVAGRMLMKRDKKGIYQRRIPNDPYCRWETCEPPWSDPLEARVSAGMGGWTAFCGDNAPLGVLRAQLTRLTAAILAGADDTALGILRLEYQAENPPALRILPPEPEPAPSVEMGRAEAAALMQHIESRLPIRVKSVPAPETAAAV